MPPPAKRRKTDQPEELTFDFDARQDYLTGFHKRKLQRIKHAQETAAKKEREQRIADRKQLREQRQEDLENHVKAVKTAIRKAQGLDSEDDDDDEDEDAWEGFEAVGDAQSSEQAADVAHEDEYIDEDRYTTVTVEPMALGSDEEEEEGDEDSDDEEASGTKKADGTVSGADATKKKRIWTKNKPATDKKKVKKKKFRYETKAERKSDRTRQRLKNKAAARARKGE